MCGAGRRERSYPFKQAELNADLRPILIHGGDHAVYEGGVWRVPKRELVGMTQVLLQTGRLKIASDLPEVSILTSELQSFQVSISECGFDSYEARTGKHDDLVLSLAMGLWLGQKTKHWVLYLRRIVKCRDDQSGGNLLS
jgi:hypothetical protein